MKDRISQIIEERDQAEMRAESRFEDEWPGIDEDINEVVADICGGSSVYTGVGLSRPYSSDDVLEGLWDSDEFREAVRGVIERDETSELERIVFREVYRAAAKIVAIRRGIELTDDDAERAMLF